MTVGRTVKRRFRATVMPVIFVGITGYFAWNVIQGNRGLVAYAKREALLRQVVEDKRYADIERDMWERRTAGLRPNRLDRDMLDEQSREMLNLAEPSEVVVQYGPKEKLF